ncbi:MAG: ecdysteroid 22-kinase family protein [Candidatus Binatia bacterium]|nr:ecdysteroid 22-kinase family protein [Candidatus Binatia bacterium]
MNANADSDFPRSPEQLDPQWFTRVLLPFFRDLGQVRALAWERIGTGQMGCNVRVALDYECPQQACGPPSLVCKFASPDPTSRATGLALRSYEIETNFYRQVAAHFPLPVPRCFFAAFDPTNGDFLIVLEDIRKGEAGDQLASCTLQQARSALDALAAIHAATWAQPSLAALDWLPRRTPEQNAQLVAFFQAAVPGFLERYGGELAARHLRVLEEFAPRFAEWVELPRGPFALVHGDFRPDNLLFLRHRAAPYRTLVIDWQTCSWGPPFADVAYFIGGAFEPEERRRYEGDLLQFYFERLRRRGVRSLSFLRCVEDHSVFAFSGITMAVAAAMLVERTTRGDRMFLTMFARHAQHVLDLGALSIFEPRRLAKLRDDRQPF